MTDYAEERRSELEVLESIFPDELTVHSETSLSLSLTPDPPVSNTEEHALSLNITYPDTYPDELPGIAVEVLEGELSEEEEKTLIEGLEEVGRESLGMAMVFTLATSLREKLSEILEERKVQEQKERDERYAREEEAAAKKVTGTKVTKESFEKWKVAFEKEMEDKARKEEEARLKALVGKEREEAKKIAIRLTGRRLFETNAIAESSDSALVGDEGGEEVDLSKYERPTGFDDDLDDLEEEADRLELSDSD